MPILLYMLTLYGIHMQTNMMINAFVTQRIIYAFRLDFKNINAVPIHQISNNRNEVYSIHDFFTTISIRYLLKINSQLNKSNYISYPLNYQTQKRYVIYKKHYYACPTSTFYTIYGQNQRA